MFRHRNFRMREMYLRSQRLSPVSFTYSLLAFATQDLHEKELLDLEELFEPFHILPIIQGCK